ncbi:MAG: hypothetical protein A2469_04730 [Candidatus Magasanikbacteria bacterium RIFOXYC2_FULL_40_16]|uniref:Uncharacterized protein n=3 Tax=Candidatus Magasanikiibacteriota TaxID=1752731 RepID=A0A1F6NDA7_9BACT|nr:MAG: hypothetical protein A2224_02325 [Candidatus Magasanikbacteria bacterium RIFOXYA2_FULL_40_20]OGH81904.1 MAG: hypothetical protein A2373_04280 [Candidatus Magasanikbacteria bacterium RIFOXYB1_FULL_40_15]OGH86436.1 MAG: hypothetical protein A2301_00205 [Candidatus Magasanikbacteria bacterium RIFOXYB2_FULL_40_13]OGH87330.1 MAG: hypothetical protein A2206_02025 [Candidatus Magasanikbacteria bacterium RIFOXYA1_FULL_40_8]OGH89340.1 MAG: hypothetical protein A2469_04730 [Candidatus Magasanikba
MSIPKVKFTNISLKAEIDGLYGFLFENDMGWGKYIIRKHPKIKYVLSLKTKKERILFFKKYIIDFRKENADRIEANKIKYNKKWQMIENKYFKLLSGIMDIDWPKNRKIITAEISINTICPRFLDEWSFSIFYNYKKLSHAMETIMHETCHFLYFEKWKKIYPNMDIKKFESPYIEWHLSEIFAPVILNDFRVQKLLKQKAFFYPEHEKIKIDNKKATAYFTDLYIKNMKKGGNFEEFLKQAYKVIKENKKLFDI